MQSEFNKNFSLVIMIVAFIALVYGTYKAILIVDKRQISTGGGIYENRVTTKRDIVDLAHKLTAECTNDLCRTQKLLDYVTNIPYKTSTFQSNSPQRTIQLNYGDCDDKSNLLISMLHGLGIEAYFVLVPKHIFVIVPLEDDRLDGVPSLMVDNRKFYILESTAKDSKVGYPLKYKLSEIDTIIDPFSNRKMVYSSIIL